MPFVVYRVAACLGTVWGCHGCAAALFWGYERGWIRDSQLASPRRDARQHAASVGKDCNQQAARGWRRAQVSLGCR